MAAKNGGKKGGACELMLTQRQNKVGEGEQSVDEEQAPLTFSFSAESSPPRNVGYTGVVESIGSIPWPRFNILMSAKSIVATGIAHGGFTWNVATGQQPTTGYVVAVQGHSSITPIPDPTYPAQRKRLAQSIVKFVRDNAETFKANPALHLGGWHDTAHSEFVLDQVEVVGDRAKAIELGTQRNQQSILGCSEQTGEIDISGDRRQRIRRDRDSRKSPYLVDRRSMARTKSWKHGRRGSSDQALPPSSSLAPSSSPAPSSPSSEESSRGKFDPLTRLAMITVVGSLLRIVGTTTLHPPPSAPNSTTSRAVVTSSLTIFTTAVIKLHFTERERCTAADRESFTAINAAHNQPDHLVTMYRAVPISVTSINSGDWVTLSKKYATTHMEGQLSGEHGQPQGSHHFQRGASEGSVVERGLDQRVRVSTRDLYRDHLSPH